MKSTTDDRRGDIFDLDRLISLLDGFYPRLMSQIDRDPNSPTYGSCDRHYWMYRLNDFDSGVVQQAGLTLAALALLAERTELARCRHLDADDRPYWRAIAGAINRRTVGLLGMHGFLDEYYPGERSFPATVFACHATLRSALLLNQRDVVDSPGLEMTARMLVRRKPSAAANQDVAGAAFLALYSRARDWRQEETRATVAALLGGQDGAGAFIEYGGFDLGYATVSLNYLAHMLDDGAFPVRDALTGLADRIADFVTPSGALGGEFASRSTSYFLPYGLVMAARERRELADRFALLDLRAAYEKLDDRYLMHYCLPSLAMTALMLTEIDPPEPARRTPSSKWRSRLHESAGLYVARNDHASVFVALNKGGSLQFDTGHQTTIDCGYRLSRGGATYATCVIDGSPEYHAEEIDGGMSLEITARFQRYRSLVASPVKTVVLRLLGFMGARLGAYFKSRLIQNAECLDDVRLIRRVTLDYRSGELAIDDAISGLAADDAVSPSPATSLRLVPSARFYQRGEAAPFLARDQFEWPGAAGRRRVVALHPPAD